MCCGADLDLVGELEEQPPVDDLAAGGQRVVAEEGRIACVWVGFLRERGWEQPEVVGASFGGGEGEAEPLLQVVRGSCTCQHPAPSPPLAHL